jgi:hypothetical protein
LVRSAGLLVLILTAGCAGIDCAPQGESPETGATVEKAPAPEPPPAAAKQEKAVAAKPAQTAPKPGGPIAVEPVPPAAAPPATASTKQSTAKLEAPAAKPPAKAPASPAQKEPAPKPAAAPLDLTSLEKGLKETSAIGVFTKLTLKNQVDALLEQFRAFYQGRVQTTLAALRQPYDMLVLKVLTLLQDGDPTLARALVASREAIWGILSDPVRFSAL